MPRSARVVLPGEVHHVTQRGVRSQAIFYEDQDRQLYLRLLGEQSKRHGLEILCYCLMTNHVHLLVVPQRKNSLADGIGEAHQRYTWALNRRLKARGYLFQGRFSSCPMEEAHVVAAARYVMRNPVRAHMVEHPWDWPWSSAAFHLNHRPQDPLMASNDLHGLISRPQDWLHLMDSERSSDEDAARQLRTATHGGQVFGSPRFVAAAELATGRTLVRRPPGRKRKEATSVCVRRACCCSRRCKSSTRLGKRPRSTKARASPRGGV